MSDLVDHLMDAQALNAKQDRALYNPDPEINSALEHALYLLKTADDGQRPHAVALVRDLAGVRQLNTLEREHERSAAGVADDVDGPITSVHEFVRLARPILGDLGNQIFSAAKHAERRVELHDLFARTAERTRTAFSNRPLLGVSKYTLMLAEHERWLDRDPDYGLGLPLTYESLGVEASA